MVALTTVGCSFDSIANQKFPWDRYSFQLPDKRGNAMLDVRPAHPFLAEYEYRLSGIYAGHAFVVEPSMQSGGAPNLRLEWFDQTDKGGPFIRIIHEKEHDARPPAPDETEIVDVKNGAIYQAGVSDKWQHAIALLADEEPMFLGTLDKSCVLNLAHDLAVKHEQVPADAHLRDN
jgi:hypothetical protein